MKLNKMPSIGQYRQIVKHIKHTAQYQGMDENGDMIMDRNALLPVLNVTGTVKVHGTNASYCGNAYEYWVQSKKNIITPQKDNAGTAVFVEKRKSVFDLFINELSEYHKINLKENSICIYFEMAGKGIQKGVAVSELDKKAYIFSDAKVVPFDENKDSYWISTFIE